MIVQVPSKLSFTFRGIPPTPFPLYLQRQGSNIRLDYLLFVSIDCLIKGEGVLLVNIFP